MKVADKYQELSTTDRNPILLGDGLRGGVSRLARESLELSTIDALP